MVKKQNYLVCQNLGASEAALKLLWRLAEVWQSAKNCEVLKLGTALISLYLVTDLLLIQTKLALVQPGLI